MPLLPSFSSRAAVECSPEPAAASVHALLEPRSPLVPTPSLAVRQHPATVGRSPLCSLVLSHPAVSRRHFAVFASPRGVVYLHDMSRHGTLVDGHRAPTNRPVPLMDGDVISIPHGPCFKVHSVSRHTMALATTARSTVKLDIHNGRYAAVKTVYCPNRTLQASLIRRLSLLACSPHPHIAQILAAVPHETELRVVQEIYPGGTLFEHMCPGGNQWLRLPELELMVIAFQLVSALHHLHSHLHTAHSHLSPAHVLFVSTVHPSRCVVAGFGVARLAHTTPCGAPGYRSPEALAAPIAHTAAPADDMWALGVILHTMLSGARPPEQVEDAEWGSQQHETPASELDDSIWHGTSSLARKTVRQLLSPHPPSRPAPTGILNGGWMSSHHATLHLVHQKLLQTLGWRQNH